MVKDISTSQVNVVSGAVRLSPISPSNMVITIPELAQQFEGHFKGSTYRTVPPTVLDLN